MVTTSSVVYPMFIMVVIHRCMEDMVTAEFLLVVSTKKQTDSFLLIDNLTIPTNFLTNHNRFLSTNKMKPLIFMVMKVRSL